MKNEVNSQDEHMALVTRHLVSPRQDCITHEAKSYKNRKIHVQSSSVFMMLVSYAERTRCLQFNIDSENCFL